VSQTKQRVRTWAPCRWLSGNPYLVSHR